MSGPTPPLPNTPSWRGAQLKKHRDDFIFTFLAAETCAEVPVARL